MQTTGEGTEQVTGGLVTPNTFRFLGVPALLGRGLVPEDAKPDAPPVFVMSYKMWVSQYNQDPSVLGRTFVLNGVPTTLVGIMPQRFTKLGADLWRAVTLDRADPQRQPAVLHVPGATEAGRHAAAGRGRHRRHRASARESLSSQLPEQFNVNVVSWVDNLVGQFRRTLYTLAAAVALLLLIACSNVANMLLARAAAREKEMAIRASLGAARARLIQQLLIESLLLAIGGAALGCLFAYAGIKGLVQLIPQGMIPQEAMIRLNVPVLLFSLAVSVVTALLFGLVPALQTARRDIVEPLKDSGKGVSGGFRGRWLRSALVVSEVALSLMLLAGAGLLMRSFVPFAARGSRVEPRQHPGRATAVAARSVHAGGGETAVLPAAARSAARAAGRGRGHGDDDAAAVRRDRRRDRIPGKTHTERWEAIFQLCSEGLLPTLGLRLVHGRWLTEADVNGARRVAVVNQTLVTKYFGHEDPIGQRIKLKLLETLPEGPVENPVFEIVGVIADAKNQGIQDPPRPEAFVPYTLTGAFERGILVRTHGDPGAMLQSVRREIWAVDRGVAVTMTGTLSDYLARVLLRGAALQCGAARRVRRRRAGPRRDRRLQRDRVHRLAPDPRDRDPHGARRQPRHRAAHGGMDGSAIDRRRPCHRPARHALLVSRVMTSQLWGVSPHDPLTLSLVVAVLVLCGLAACYVPALRATRVEPVRALRME